MDKGELNAVWLKPSKLIKQYMPYFLTLSSQTAGIIVISTELSKL